VRQRRGPGAGGRSPPGPAGALGARPAAPSSPSPPRGLAALLCYITSWLSPALALGLSVLVVFVLPVRGLDPLRGFMRGAPRGCIICSAGSGAWVSVSPRVSSGPGSGGSTGWAGGGSLAGATGVVSGPGGLGPVLCVILSLGAAAGHLWLGGGAHGGC